MEDQQEYEQEINNLRHTSIVICFLIVLASCENSEEDIKNFIDADNLSEEQLTSSEIIYTENGHLKVKVTSKNMERFSDEEEIIELSGGVHFDFYKLDSTNTKSEITCKIATINNTKNVMIANGDVNITIGDTIILTQQLIWEKDKQERYFEDSEGNSIKYNTDLIYSNQEVTKRYQASETSFSSFRCTSDFGENNSPFILKNFSSDSIMSINIAEN